MWYRGHEELLPMHDLVVRGDVDAGAIFSTDAKQIYRYAWHRRHNGMFLGDGMGRIALFDMLNPSTATERKEDDDPTVGRCMDYTTILGCDTTLVGNLYPFRSTDPAGLRTAADPHGPHNLAMLVAMLVATVRSNGIVIAAWGQNAEREALQRFADARSAAEQIVGPIQIHCLLKLDDGTPAHPLVRRKIPLRHGGSLELWP